MIDRALVMTLGMSIYMLWRLLGYASLVGLAVMISFAPVMGWFSKASMVRGCSAACLAAHGLCSERVAKPPCLSIPSWRNISRNASVFGSCVLGHLCLVMWWVMASCCGFVQEEVLGSCCLPQQQQQQQPLLYGCLFLPQPSSVVRQAATKDLTARRDVRTALINEAMSGIRVIKVGTPWSPQPFMLCCCIVPV